MANVSTVSNDNVENMSFFFSNSILIDESIPEQTIPEIPEQSIPEIPAETIDD